jgi:ribosomal protein S18 acetylase RimI-like enzyme
MTVQKPGSGNGIHHPDPNPPAPSSCQPIFTLLAESDVEEVSRLYTEVFLADEPTTRRHAPDPAFFLHHARFYARFLLKNPLSFIARDERTGTIAGFIFCVDLTDDPGEDGPEMAEFLTHFGELVALIDELEAQHLDRNGIGRGSVLHVFQIGVSRHYRGRGLAQALIRRVLAHAGERGFRQVVADCTGPASRSAFARCGFYEAGSVSYNAFRMNDDRFFAGIDGGISLMVKER